jgi:hypothetical protein
MAAKENPLFCRWTERIPAVRRSYTVSINHITNRGGKEMKKKYLMVATLSGFLMAGAAAWAAPFGGPDDVKYSQALWKALTKAHMVGPHAIMSTPYKGQAPHGAVLDTLDGTVKVKGTTGAVIVKRNYGGPGVSKSAVANNPGKYLTQGRHRHVQAQGL